MGRRTIAIILVIVVLANLLSLPAPALATGGVVQRIEVDRWLNGSHTVVTVYNGGWVNRTVYFDNHYGVGVTIYVSGGTPNYYYQLYGTNSYNQSWTGSTTSHTFWPWPPIEADYRAYVDGNTPGYFYLLAEYPDLIASVPRPNDNAISPPFCVNQEVDWYVTVTNQDVGGDSGGTAGSTDLFYYLGTSPSDFSNYLGSDGVGTLAPSESAVENEPYTFTSSDIGSSRYLNVQADASDDEEESNENNNTNSYGPFTVLDTPGDVTLASPGNTTTTCSTAPTFQWNTYPNATQYRIQIDNNPDLLSPEYQATVTGGGTSYTPSPALTPGVWYWRVNATNACGSGIWGSIWNVTILTTPDQPGLLNPQPNASTCNTTPDFSWSSVWSAAQYRLQIDDDPNFGSALEVTRSITTYTPSAALAPGTYNWRVRAENACNAGSYSPARQFTIGAPAGVPTLSEPGNGTSACTQTPTFSWSMVSNATSYILQADNNNDFSSPEVNQTTLATSYAPTGSLPLGTTFWRVMSQGTCGNSSWTSPWTIDLMDVPPSPSLSTPAPNAELCLLNPTFSWETAFQAADYHIQVDDASTFTSPLVDQPVASSGYGPVNLTPGIFYWHVRSHNQCGYSNWTIPARQFTLLTPTVTSNFLGSPLSGNIPLAVSFSDSSAGAISARSWSFGDGGTSTLTNPLHTYNTEGNFTVSLTVTGTCGSDSEVKPDYIHATDTPPVIYDRLTSNVRDTSFTASWWTDLDSNGHIEYGTSPSLGQTANDVRSSSYSGLSHYVTVSSLQPNTTYYFDLVSGATRDNNGGQHYIVTTGPTLSLPTSDTAYGLLFKPGAVNHADGAIVIITIKDNNGLGSSGQASPLSSLVDSNGYWYANLGNARTGDFGQYFVYSLSGDSLLLFGQGGPDGYTCRKVDTGEDTPAISLTLGTGCADIRVSKDSTPNPAKPGGMLTYTLSITNSGPTQASGVVVTDTLPVGVSFVSSAPGSPTCEELSNVVSCEIGDISSGSNVRISIIVSVHSSASGMITNVAQVEASEPDVDTGNNSATVNTLIVNSNVAPTFTSIPVITAAENVLYTYTVTADDPDLIYGDTLTFTALTAPSWLTLTNHGGGTATLAGTATVADLGNHTVVLRVTDSGGLTDTQTFTIAVWRWVYLPLVLRNTL